jgi:hypothetical protein
MLLTMKLNLPEVVAFPKSNPTLRNNSPDVHTRSSGRARNIYHHLITSSP